MFTLLVVLTGVLAITAGALAVVGLMRRKWLICLAGVPFAVGALTVGVAAYQSMPTALAKAFTDNSSETATTLSLLAIVLAMVSVAATSGSRARGSH